MKDMKNISAALLSLVCFSAVSAAAFADGPVAGAINGIGRAGEDIVDGAEDLINGVVNGVTAAPGVDDESDPDGDSMTSDPDNTSDTDGDLTSDVESDPVTDDSDVPAGETSDGNDAADGLDSGASDEPASDADSDAGADSNNVAGAANPGTGVTYGFTAVAAVLAAAGVAAATSRRKR